MIILFRSSYVFNLRNAWKQWSKFQRIVTIIFITMGTNNRYYISLLLDFQNRNRVRYYGRFPRLNGLCKIRRKERFLISFIRCNKIYISILSFFFFLFFSFRIFLEKGERALRPFIDESYCKISRFSCNSFPLTCVEHVSKNIVWSALLIIKIFIVFVIVKIKFPSPTAGQQQINQTSQLAIITCYLQFNRPRARSRPKQLKTHSLSNTRFHSRFHARVSCISTSLENLVNPY